MRMRTRTSGSMRSGFVVSSLVACCRNLCISACEYVSINHLFSASVKHILASVAFDISYRVNDLYCCACCTYGRVISSANIFCCTNPFLCTVFEAFYVPSNAIPFHVRDYYSINAQHNSAKG